MKNPYKKADAYTKAAKAQGFPARSVFKLEEIDRRVRLFRQGQRVLDLGAAPGSWSMYASQKVGPKGRIFAVDISEIRAFLGANVTVLRGDALSLSNDQLAESAPYDIVLSDMAPSTTGSKVADQARSFELFDRAVTVAAALSVPGGAFVGKLFMSEDFITARDRLRSLYTEVRNIRPDGTRAQSSEVFLVGLGRKKDPG